jgi:hypothetical protein
VITINKYNKNYENTPFNDDININSCSTYDCTGLIPSAITDLDQLEAYEDLYPYLPTDEEVGDYFDDYRDKKN